MSSTPKRKSGQKYTWADYQKWDGDERWELIGGEAYAMAPAPNLYHQDVVTSLGALLWARLQKGPCRCYVSPIDVKLSDHDVVQPDLIIVCDKSVIRDGRVEGAPTIVAEVVSPSSHVNDRLRKLNLYAAKGIREYWIVTPTPPSVELFLLNDSGYYELRGTYEADDELHSLALPQLRIPLKKVFGYPPPASGSDLEVCEKPARTAQPRSPFRNRPIPRYQSR